MSVPCITVEQHAVDRYTRSFQVDEIISKTQLRDPSARTRFAHYLSSAAQEVRKVFFGIEGVAFVSLQQHIVQVTIKNTSDWDNVQDHVIHNLKQQFNWSNCEVIQEQSLVGAQR